MSAEVDGAEQRPAPARTLEVFSPARERWWRTPQAAFLAATLCVCCAVYPDVVLAGRTFLPVGRVGAVYEQPPFSAGYRSPPSQRAELDAGAHAWQVHPWAYAERRALLRGELPFWDPHNGLGHPLLPNGMTQTFNLLHDLVLLNPDSPALWDLHFFLLRIIAGFFSCWLLYELGVHKDLCLVGAAFGALHPSFTLFLTRADLEASALFPVLLTCLARLRRRPGFWPASAVAISLAATIVSGHPEPATANVVIAALIGLAWTALPRHSRWRYLGWAAFASALAALVSAPYWWPFLGMVSHSASVHAAGAGTTSLPASLAFQWLLPSLYEKHGFFRVFYEPQAIGYLAAAMSSLASIGIVAFAIVPGARARLLWLIVPVFFALKIFGAPFTSWVGRLPLLTLMPFEVYFQFPVLFALGIGGVVAASLLLELPARKRGAVLFLSVAAIALFAAAPAWATSTDDRSPWWKWQSAYAVAIAALVALAIHLGRTRWAAYGLLAVVAADLAVYRVPLARRGNLDAPGAYVNWLLERQKEGQPFRVLGTGGLLMPNVATAFPLDDVRITDALIIPEFREFERRFVEQRLMWNWFMTAMPGRGWGFDAASRIFDWLNVRYVVTSPDRSGALESGPVPRAMLAAPHPAWAATRYLIDGVELPVVFQHPDDSGEVVVDVPREYPVLSFAVAQDPMVWNAKGDGATYEVAAVEGGRKSSLWARDIDPKNRAQDRHWIAGRVDLSRFAGREMKLAFSARSPELTADWGGWADLHWESPSGMRQPRPATRYRLVFRDPADSTAAVYENTAAWPRVFASAAPIREPTENRVLDRIAALVDEPGPHVIVGPDFPAADWQALCSAANACGRPVAAEIAGIFEEGSDAGFTVRTAAPAVVVHASMLYRGWTAQVDGRPVPLFRVNHLFRGVLVGPGKHEVRLRYHPPEWPAACWAFAAGCGIWVAVVAARRLRGKPLTAHR